MTDNRPEGVRLEELAVHEVSCWWGRYNRELFGGAMAPPLLSLSDSERRIGVFNSATRELSLSRTLLLSGSWVDVKEVLKHEMAHQFVYEVLGVSDETPHGATFQHVCRQRGIDSSAVGVKSQAEEVEGGVVDRVKKLLALAQSDNTHEAEIAMAHARRLMLGHNISEQQATMSKKTRFVSVSVGGAQVRMPSWRKMLAGMLARYFFVESVIVPSFSVSKGKRATEIELVGTEENVGVATYIHDMLIRSADRRWSRYQKARLVKRRGDKSQFYFGVVSGFSGQLKAERVRCDQEGLVWSSDPALKRHMTQRFPRLYSGGRVTTKVGDAYRQGHQHGSSVSIRKGITAQRAGATRLIENRAQKKGSA